MPDRTPESHAGKGRTRLRRPGWLFSDSWRVGIAMSAATVTIVGLVRTLEDGDQRGFWLSTLIGWVVFAVLHAAMVMAAYAGLGRRFTGAMLAGRRSRRRWSLLWGTGERKPTSWALQVALCALIGVALLAFVPGMRDPLLLVIGSGLVAVTWIDVLVVYAIAYARANVRHGGVDFPGEQPRSLSDYVYLSAAVQSTFGTTDASITTRRMRRLVTSHALLAFVFNTFIVAMLVSLILAR